MSQSQSQLNLDDFISWVQERKPASVRAHIRQFTEAKGIVPSFRNVKSLTNRIYTRLRASASDFPTIIYTPQPDRAPRDTVPLQFSDSRELQVVSKAIETNGFTFPETTTALTRAHSTHITASVSQQKAAAGLVTAFTAEIAIKDVKLANSDEMKQYHQQTSNDLRATLEVERRNTAFLQEMIKRNGGSGSGTDLK